MNSPKKSITLIAAMAANRCIGVGNKMPWHIPEDFKHFKTLTMGKPCIMGRKTFESIIEQLGKTLPGRDNIVISRSGYAHAGAHIYDSLESALENTAGPELCIVGGAQIYKQALPFADILELTLIHKVVAGDAFFPEFPEKDWYETRREDISGDPAFSFIRYERR